MLSSQFRMSSICSSRTASVRLFSPRTVISPVVPSFPYSFAFFFRRSFLSSFVRSFHFSCSFNSVAAAAAASAPKPYQYIHPAQKRKRATPLPRWVPPDPNTPPQSKLQAISLAEKGARPLSPSTQVLNYLKSLSHAQSEGRTRKELWEKFKITQSNSIGFCCTFIGESCLLCGFSCVMVACLFA